MAAASVQTPYTIRVLSFNRRNAEARPLTMQLETAAQPTSTFCRVTHPAAAIQRRPSRVPYPSRGSAENPFAQFRATQHWPPARATPSSRGPSSQACATTTGPQLGAVCHPSSRPQLRAVCNPSSPRVLRAACHPCGPARSLSRGEPQILLLGDKMGAHRTDPTESPRGPQQGRIYP